MLWAYGLFVGCGLGRRNKIPTYRFRNKETGKTWEKFMGISEADEYLATVPHIERVPNGAPLIVGGVGTKPKIDDAFRDKLKEIKKRNPRNKIDTY